MLCSSLLSLWLDRGISTVHATFISFMALYFVFFSDLFSDQRSLETLTVFRNSPLSTFGLGVSFDLSSFYLTSYSWALINLYGTLLWCVFCIGISWLLSCGSWNDLLVIPLFRRIRICKLDTWKLMWSPLVSITWQILICFSDFPSLLIWNSSSVFFVLWRGSALHIHGFNLWSDYPRDQS